mgnify:CR=1 FL=1
MTADLVDWHATPKLFTKDCDLMLYLKRSWSRGDWNRTLFQTNTWAKVTSWPVLDPDLATPGHLRWALPAREL